MRGFIADGLLRLSTAFNTASVWLKDAAICVLTFRHRGRRS